MSFREELQHLSPVWHRVTDIVVDRGEGAYVYDVNGRRYLDFTCGYGVTNTGHCHPRVVSAAREQIGKIIHAQVNIAWHEPMLRLVKELRDVTPEGLDSFFFSNSGAEAIEASVKLARFATRRAGIIVFKGSFHGRTVAAMSLTTSNAKYRSNYQPLMAGVSVAPYANCYHCPVGDRSTSVDGVKGFPGEDVCEMWCLEELEDVLRLQSAPGDTAAILLEPALGEGGYVHPPRAWLRGVSEIARENGILLVADEIQSGFGRTGRFFAVEHAGVSPDIVVMAKALASGFPLSGIATRPGIMEKWQAGTHGGTYGGNAVSCAAAVATLHVLRDEGLVENAARMGDYLMENLRGLRERHPLIGDVRGRGLMVATEFTAPDGTAASIAGTMATDCQDRGMLVLTAGHRDNIIRWIPPLIVTEDQIDVGVEIFEEALAAAE